VGKVKSDQTIESDNKRKRSPKDEGEMGQIALERHLFLSTGCRGSLGDTVDD